MTDDLPAPDDHLHERVAALLDAMSLEEKVWMMSGHGFSRQFRTTRRYCDTPYAIGGGNERLGVPHFYFTDGPRGVVTGAATAFPVPMARGASFDADLEWRIGDAIGRECRAVGATLFGGVCINLLRHPAWGRAQETYGEDPVLLGELGAALVEGVQQHNVVATIKHFACNSMENARFRIDVRIAPRPLRELYLYHFERCVAAGAGAVMSAYNRVNGDWCGHNRGLLTDILRGDWGFEGFVYSDFLLGCHGADAANAGLDVEAPETRHFGDELLAAVAAGAVPEATIETAARRVLTTLSRFTERPDPERYEPALLACPQHRALALEAAEKSIVLLQNRDVLPLRVDIERLALIGRLADLPNLGDRGSSNVHPPEVTTPRAGLQDALGLETVGYSDGSDVQQAAAMAAAAQVAVVVVGFTHEDEGEYIPGRDASLQGEGAIGGDRDPLDLKDEDVELIRSVCAANAQTVVVLMAGSAVLMESWKDLPAAILMLWYPGMRGGEALARVLLGAASPSGRLPFTIPADPADLPAFDRDADSIDYDLWHGYGRFDVDGREPAFPFGFGLGYSRFAFEAPLPERCEDGVRAVIGVTNIGSRSADCVVPLFVVPPLDSQVAMWPRRLAAFTRVSLDAGERAEVTLQVPERLLQFWDEPGHRFRTVPGEWGFEVGFRGSPEGVAVARLRIEA